MLRFKIYKFSHLLLFVQKDRGKGSSTKGGASVGNNNVGTLGRSLSDTRMFVYDLSYQRRNTFVSDTKYYDYLRII